MRQVLWLLVMFLVTVMLAIGTGAVSAGMFPDLDKKIANSKAQELAINKQRAREMKDICDRYAKEKEQRDLERRAQIQAAVAKPAADDGVVPAGKPFRKALTSLLGFGMHLGGAGIYGGATGLTSPSDSPLEYLLFGVPSFCRGVNTSFDQMAEFTVRSAIDTGNVFDRATCADPSQLGYVASETIKWGPIAQVIRTGASATPAACVAAGVLAPVAGMCYGGTIATLASTNTVGAYFVGKGVDYIERALTRYFAGK